jgi:hypothetical protein
VIRIHAIQTGTVAVKARQRRGSGPKAVRLVNTLRDPEWTEPLPILAWVIEHPEGLIAVDTGETSRSSQAGYFPRWHPYFRFGVRTAVNPDQEIGPSWSAATYRSTGRTGLTRPPWSSARCPSAQSSGRSH